MEEKVYKSNRISLELLRQLKDAEMEIESLRDYQLRLKQRVQVYVPAKSDEIDKKLADYINSRQEMKYLRILFERHHQG